MMHHATSKRRSNNKDQVLEVAYDRSWYTELGLGVNAIAVTAPVCPRKTEIGNPSGKRHWSTEKVDKPLTLQQKIFLPKIITLQRKQEDVCQVGGESYNSNAVVIWRRRH